MFSEEPSGAEFAFKSRVVPPDRHLPVTTSKAKSGFSMSRSREGLPGRGTSPGRDLAMGKSCVCTHVWQQLAHGVMYTGKKATLR